MRFPPAVLAVLLLLAGCAGPGAPGAEREGDPAHADPCPACGRALDPGARGASDSDIERAGVGGEYRDLLRTVYAPGDRSAYGEFRDWGPWSGTSYAGVRDLPPAHWVYVAPNWYLWGWPEPTPVADPLLPR